MLIDYTYLLYLTVLDPKWRGLLQLLVPRAPRGRAVITALAGDPNYTLRGLTRNLQSRAAQELRSQGVEVVAADLDNLASLKAAFAGSHAVYGVTGVDESLAKYDLVTLEKVEETWGKNIAQAAAETVGLQHFIWSTLPRASEISKGRYHLSNHAPKNKVGRLHPRQCRPRS